MFLDLNKLKNEHHTFFSKYIYFFIFLVKMFDKLIVEHKV